MLIESKSKSIYGIYKKYERFFDVKEKKYNKLKEILLTFSNIMRDITYNITIPVSQHQLLIKIIKENFSNSIIAEEG